MGKPVVISPNPLVCQLGIFVSICRATLPPPRIAHLSGINCSNLRSLDNRGCLADLDQMPVQSPIKPADSEGLRAKILATKPYQEGIILAEVKAHLDISGNATYEQTIDDTREVALGGKCIVFLIRGSFEVGGCTISRNGLGHPVYDEKGLQLQQHTALVIIDTN